jgi:6,7-dimethyl-8-ribityllumazine synthase
MRDGGTGAKPMPQCGGRRFALVVSRFYEGLAAQLVDGAKQALHDCGVADEDISVYDVPGSFEIPLACRNLIDADRFDALVALGVIIRGETPHFDFVANECARGVMAVQLATGVPIGFGVLTTDTAAQAEERADPKRGNKGYHAAYAAAALLRIGAGAGRAGFRA